MRPTGSPSSRPASFEEAAAVERRSVHCAERASRKADISDPGRRRPRLRRVGRHRNRGGQLAKAFGCRTSPPCATRRTSSSCAARSRRGHRLPARGLQRKRHDLRRHLRRGGQALVRRCRRSLKPGGIFLETDLGFMWHVPLLALATRWLSDKRATLPIRAYSKEDVLHVKELIEAGRYQRCIDRHLSAGRGRRGDEVRRDGAEDRECGADRQLMEKALFPGLFR